VLALKRRPCRVEEEGRQSEEYDQWLDPPGVAAAGFAKPAHGQPDGCSQCRHATDPEWRAFRASAVAAGTTLTAESALTITAPAEDFKWMQSSEGNVLKAARKSNQDNTRSRRNRKKTSSGHADDLQRRDVVTELPVFDVRPASAE
jgi:hypothetical protein